MQSSVSLSREENSLVEQFVFEVLVIFVESLALAHSDERSMGNCHISIVDCALGFSCHYQPLPLSLKTDYVRQSLLNVFCFVTFVNLFMPEFAQTDL